MSGIFGTLNTANKGLMASQTALHTTGHNISNAHTDGYSRQRVDMKADLSFHYTGVGQLGTGVKMEQVVRMVDEYVTKQIREENGSLQRFMAQNEVLEQLEIVFNEPSDTSLNFNIAEMFEAWQELSKNPELPVAKTIVVDKSITLAETFNHIMTQIDDLLDATEGLIGDNIDSFNDIVEELEGLNKQIFNITVKGHKANDLLDQRDLLLKELSSISNFRVDEDKYGRVSIAIGAENNDDWNILEAGKSRNALTRDGQIFNSINNGQIKGHLDALDVLAGRKIELQMFGETLAKAVNTVHGGKLEDEGIVDFFTFEDGKLDVNEFYGNRPSNLVAGTRVDSPDGDGKRALAIARLRTTKIDFSGESEFEINEDLELIDQEGGTTIGGFYNEIITRVGISKQHAENTVANQEILLGQLEYRRESTSGVSIDEEVANLIKFNTAYAANARVISTLSQMLDTLIGMGV